MRLLGRWAWWAPRPLAAFWRRFPLAHAEKPSAGTPERDEVPV
ncbi:hypothetical protein AB0L85_18475 [Streptomyces sp. NPDC052051]